MEKIINSINQFLTSNKNYEIIRLDQSQNIISDLNYPQLFFNFYTHKYGSELYVSKSKLLMDIKDVIQYVGVFLDSDKETDSIDIHNSLRRPLRKLKRLYPQLHYYARHTGKIYQLILSKSKYEIPFEDLEWDTRKMFISYSGLKIEPSIDKATYDLLKRHLNLDEKFKELSDTIWDLGGEKEFINKHYDVIDKIVKFLTNSPKYYDWVDKNVKCDSPKISTKNINVYQDHNDGKCFISIDLQSANYQVFHLDGIIEESWDDFLKRFTPNKYYRTSRQLRLRALGHESFMPKKRQMCWKNIVTGVLNKMVDDNILSIDKLAALNNDEIIININDTDDVDDYRQYLTQKFPMLDFSVKLFKIKNFGRHYVKIDQSTGKSTFKCVNAKELPQLVTIYDNFCACDSQRDSK